MVAEWWRHPKYGVEGIYQVEVSMLRYIGEVSQRLEQGSEAIELRMDVTSIGNTHATVDGLWQELQAKFGQDHDELQQK